MSNASRARRLRLTHVVGKCGDVRDRVRMQLGAGALTVRVDIAGNNGNDVRESRSAPAPCGVETSGLPRVASARVISRRRRELIQKAMGAGALGAYFALRTLTAVERIVYALRYRHH